MKPMLLAALVAAALSGCATAPPPPAQYEPAPSVLRPIGIPVAFYLPDGTSCQGTLAQGQMAELYTLRTTIKKAMIRGKGWRQKCST